MIKELFIGKDTTYGEKQSGGVVANMNEINDLEEGAIALFDDKNNFIPAAVVAGALVGVSQFKIVIGTSEGVRHSQLIDRNAFYQKKPYKAAVKQKSFIGQDGASGSLNLPGTLIVGDVATLLVSDTTSRTGSIADDRQYHYEEAVASGDTAALLVGRLVAQINADVDGIVNATIVGAGLGIELEAKEEATIFEIGGDELFRISDIWELGAGNSLEMIDGHGTARMMNELESEATIGMGDQNRTHLSRFWYKVGSKIEAENYLTYDFEWSHETRHVRNHNVRIKSLGIALPTGAGIVATLDTILGVLLDNNPPAMGSGTGQPPLTA